MKKSPCDKCDGRCCSYRDIMLEEDEKDKYISTVTDEGYFALPMTANGKCPYLKDNRCSIYETRPKGCRIFECINCYRNVKGKIKLTFFLEDNPDIIELIEKED